MAGVEEQPFHSRSNSMPSTSHPTSQRVDEELHALSLRMASSPMTSQLMCAGLQGVGDLHEVIDELLRLPSSQVCLQTSRKRWVEEQLDFSLRLLDLIGATREAVVSIREHIHDLQSAIRRKGDAAVSSRKKAQMTIRDCLKSLKQMCGKIAPGSDDDTNDQLVKVSMEARGVTISLLRSIISFLSKPKTKASRWFVIPNAISKRNVGCEGECGSATEEHTVDMVLQAAYECILCRDSDPTGVQKAHNNLHKLAATMENLESGLVLLCRHLIRHRVCLLNIISL